MRAYLPAKAAAAGLLIFPSLAGAQPVKFQLNPETGTAYYAVAHMSLKCKASTTNPSFCGLRWIAVRHGDVRELRGEYCLQVKWEDGRSYRGGFVAVSGSTQLQLDIVPSTVAPSGACR